MLPLDPVKHDEYRAKLRAARALQAPPEPKGTKHSADRRANVSAACKASDTHRSKHQSGDKNANFGIGSWLDKNGYRLVRLDGKDVYEHRLVMETMIGRKLLAEETVHHKNGNRSDNRDSNLELWSSRNPKGQRIDDKVKYAREILTLYAGTIYDQDWLD